MVQRQLASRCGNSLWSLWFDFGCVSCTASSAFLATKNWEDDSALIDGTLLEKQEKMETRMGDVVATRREISYMFDLGNQQGTVYVPKIEVPQPIFIQIGDPGSEIQVRRNTKNPLLHQLEIEAPKQTKIPDKAAIITNAVLLGIVFLAGLFVATSICHLRECCEYGFWSACDGWLFASNLSSIWLLERLCSFSPGLASRILLAFFAPPVGASKAVWSKRQSCSRARFAQDP